MILNTFFLEIPQYLYEAGWTSNGKMIACVQVMNSF